MSKAAHRLRKELNGIKGIEYTKQLYFIGGTNHDALSLHFWPIPKIIQNLVERPRQSPGIEIVEEGACISAIHTPSSTTQSRELSLRSSDQILDDLGYVRRILARKCR